MSKPVFVLVVGALCGGAIAYWMAANSDGAAQAFGGSGLLEGLASVARGGAAANARVTVANRTAAYRDAAELRSAREVAAELARVAAHEPSVTRKLTIDALLARLAELDADAAVNALGEISSAIERRERAIGLLAVLGDSAEVIAQIAAALPASDRVSFRGAALARRAERDPDGALRAMLALDSASARQRAAQEVAATWARQDPLDALAQAALLPAELQSVFSASVSAEWARLDPSGYLQAFERETEELNAAGLQLLAASNPEQVLRAAETVNGSRAEALRAIGYEALAQRDPRAAIARLEAMPAGQEREQLRRTVAHSYGAHSPDDALPWARTLSPPSTDVERTVLAGIASIDVERALRLALARPAGIEGTLLLPIASQAALEPSKTAQIAQILSARADSASQEALGALLEQWSLSDTERALAWAEAKSASAEVDGALLIGMAKLLAGRDAVAAAAFAERLPPNVRASWIAQVAGPYARNDVEGALAWLARYQGEPGYDPAMLQIVAQTAQTDPRAAARIVESASADVQTGMAQQVVSQWARQDPQAAAQWAAGLGETRARASAVATAAASWAARDFAAARGWTLSLPAGAARDQALGRLLQRSASTRLDDGLLAAFSSDAAREAGIAPAIPTVARRDAEEAQRLIATYITDPTLLRQIDERISTTSQTPTSLEISNGVITFR